MAVELVTDQEWNAKLESNEKVVVKYFADWCGSCKLIAPKYRRLSDDERFTEIAFLEVNAETNEVARKSAGVDNLPFFAIFRNGEMVEGSATSKEENVIKMLEQLN